MNPEIEPLLEDALASMQPALANVGRIDLEPDYESGLTREDLPGIEGELQRLLAAVTPDPAQVASHDGQSLPLDAYPGLKRFFRRIVLHRGDGAPTVLDVVPPGNWI